MFTAEVSGNDDDDGRGRLRSCARLHSSHLRRSFRGRTELGNSEYFGR